MKSGPVKSRRLPMTSGKMAMISKTLREMGNRRNPERKIRTRINRHRAVIRMDPNPLIRSNSKVAASNLKKTRMPATPRANRGNSRNPNKRTTKNPSLGQSLMQTLKNMMSNSQNQQSNNKGNQDSQQSNSQGAPQSGNANASDANQSGQKGDSRGSSEAQQKASQSASNGAGSQKGLKQTRTDFDSHPVTAVPDRVALEATNYKEQIRMRMQTEAGTAQMATHDVSPQALAVVNGAEQENIPARYRMYVQRYFEHTENPQPESVPQGNGQQ